MEYVTVQTTGNATDFGDLSAGRADLTACGNTTRGVFAGGTNTSGAASNIIDYITPSTPGNAADFGDLTASKLAVGSLAGGS